MGNINTHYPLWFFALVILAGLGYAAFLYWKEKNFAEKPKILRYTLFALRAIAISLISFFLLNPYFENMSDEEKKPIMILAQDLSQSVSLSDKSNAKTEILSQLSEIKEVLNEKFDFRELSFGESVDFGLQDSFTQSSTNFSDLFSFVEGQYYGLPIAGMVLLSDGIYNEGQNPVYDKRISNIPVYSVALGDTIPKADIYIKNVYHNKIGFLGDKIPIQFDVSAKGYPDQNLSLNIHEITGSSRKLLDTKPIQVKGSDFFTTDNFIVPALETGTRQYQISISARENELSKTNNYRNVFIEIIDSRIDVLILANSPHPDIAALKQTLGTNKNYLTRFKKLEELTDLENPDVVILHNIPSNKKRSEYVLSEIRKKKIPHLFIVGQQTIIPVFNTSQDIVKVKTNLNSGNESEAVYNDKFNSFIMEEDLVKEIEQFPPLTSPYGSYEIQPDSKILLFQKIGNIETTFPMLAFSDRNGLKSAILLGEGFWKWRLNTYGKKGNHDSVDQLILKSIQYLSIKEDKRKWQVQIEKNIWNENERILFNANYYNDNFEPVNSFEAKMTLIHESGDRYDHVFSRSANYYILDAGYLPTGKYNYSAEIDVSAEDNIYSGSFIVKDLQIELVNLEARHDILYQLSNNSGGKLFYPDQMDQLKEELAQSEARSVIFSTKTQRSVISLKWLFFLILSLISLEWMLRRYHGSY